MYIVSTYCTTTSAFPFIPDLDGGEDLSGAPTIDSANDRVRTLGRHLRGVMPCSPASQRESKSRVLLSLSLSLSLSGLPNQILLFCYVVVVVFSRKMQPVSDEVVRVFITTIACTLWMTLGRLSPPQLWSYSLGFSMVFCAGCIVYLAGSGSLAPRRLISRTQVTLW